MFSDNTSMLPTSRMDSTPLIHSHTQDKEFSMHQTSAILGVSNFARGQLRMMRSSSQVLHRQHKAFGANTNAKSPKSNY